MFVLSVPDRNQFHLQSEIPSTRSHRGDLLEAVTERLNVSRVALPGGGLTAGASSNIRHHETSATGFAGPADHRYAALGELDRPPKHEPDVGAPRTQTPCVRGH